MNGYAYVLIKLYLQKQLAGWIWATGPSLPNSILRHRTGTSPAFLSYFTEGKEELTNIPRQICHFNREKT